MASIQSARAAPGISGCDPQNDRRGSSTNSSVKTVSPKAQECLRSRIGRAKLRFELVSTDNFTEIENLAAEARPTSHEGLGPVREKRLTRSCGGEERRGRRQKKDAPAAVRAMSR
jgi:hypothetical protein